MITLSGSDLRELSGKVLPLLENYRKSEVLKTLHSLPGYINTTFQNICK